MPTAVGNLHTSALVATAAAAAGVTVGGSSTAQQHAQDSSSAWQQQQQHEGSDQQLTPLQEVLRGSLAQGRLLPRSVDVMDVIISQGLGSLRLYLEEGSFQAYTDLTSSEVGKKGESDRAQDSHCLRCVIWSPTTAARGCMRQSVPPLAKRCLYASYSSCSVLPSASPDACVYTGVAAPRCAEDCVVLAALFSSCAAGTQGQDTRPSTLGAWRNGACAWRRWR